MLAYYLSEETKQILGLVAILAAGIMFYAAPGVIKYLEHFLGLDKEEDND